MQIPLNPVHCALCTACTGHRQRSCYSWPEFPCIQMNPSTWTGKFSYTRPRARLQNSKRHNDAHVPAHASRHPDVVISGDQIPRAVFPGRRMFHRALESDSRFFKSLPRLSPLLRYICMHYDDAPRATAR